MVENDLMSDLRELLLEGKVTTQENICDALGELGHSVNQSKVSRLLRKVGAVKSKDEQGAVVYRLPKEPAPPTTSSQLSDLIIDIVCNETNIIVHTSPGSAQLIGRVLDYNKSKIEILGSIAGDDTVFIAPKSIYKIDQTVTEIKSLLV